jgi:hypothetical protein
MDDAEMLDSLFRDAVSAIDAGDVAGSNASWPFTPDWWAIALHRPAGG